MNQHINDLFKDYELPFKTVFEKQIEHLDQVHDETELIWLMRGQATVTCERESYRMTSHTMFMINAFQHHSIKSSEDAMLIVFRLNEEHFTGMVFETKVYTFFNLLDKYKQIPLVISQLLELLIAPSHSQLIRYKIIGYYNILIFELYTLLLKNKYPDVKPKKSSENLIRLNRVIDYVSENFQGKPSLEQLSKTLNISSFRLSHFIKENLGISYRDFLNNMRFEYALIQLRDNNNKIVEISKDAGFSDVKYLNQMIKKVFNKTALQYRKHYQNDINRIVNNTIDRKSLIDDIDLCLKEAKQTFNL